MELTQLLYLWASGATVGFLEHSCTTTALIYLQRTFKSSGFILLARRQLNHFGDSLSN